MSHLLLFRDLSFVYATMIRLFCLGLVISSLEYLYTLTDYGEGGLFSWKVLKLTPKVQPFYHSHLDLLLGKTGFGILIAIRLAASVALLIQPDTGATVVFLALIAASSLVVVFRNPVGNDGSDQMNSIICLTLLATFLFKGAGIGPLGLYFICFQVVISYETAGIAKLISPKWNRGMAIYEIMNTESYGSRTISRWLGNLPPGYTLVFNWNIIVFECLYFLVIFFPYPWYLVFMCWGLLFHLYNAVCMGLNGFFWAFLACYPAIIYVNFCLH
jgi:hypothetical protein